MGIASRLIEYEHDGKVFEGYLAWDEAVTGRRPLVTVSHAWSGRSAFENAKAEALAGLGYAGFALDVYGKGVRGSGPEENAALMTPLRENRAELTARLQAGVAAGRAAPQVDAGRVAAIGFCFGGLCALDLARSGLDLRGVASFHGLFDPPARPAQSAIRAKVLALHGWDDPMVPPEQVLALAAELSDAGADWQLHAYGATMHAFTNPEADDPSFGTVYDQDADRRSWLALKNFLHEIFQARS